ncbi:glycosyl hydrolase 2 galactose-binding domain-containing protein [Occallatibacter savannae]|uniref:glycosyl hydrolase 2 galactose-binding domain-containing protein n=1 Tax=Occallatibacter savannae TaxID=1002691 RepID=UPI000D68EADF|nr:discoidin domain-containing protein [Occallatibacter savannae]
MSTSRRNFLKTTMIAGAAVAVDGVSTFAQARHPNSTAGQPTETASAESASTYTAGIGIYPGEPSENFDPVLAPDTSGKYRNLALLRPAFHSSSYDYNLTAQLVTDGMKATTLPRWVVVSEGTRGPLPKTERETVLDHCPMNTLEVMGGTAQIDIQIAGGEAAPEVDRIQLFVVSPMTASASSLKFTISTSDDGRTWQEVGNAASTQPTSTAGYPPDFCAPNHFFTPTIQLNSPSKSRMYRVVCSTGAHGSTAAFGASWRIGQVVFSKGDERVEIGGPYSFTSAWMSAGLGEEWVYVDLGARCEFDHVKLYWIARASQGMLQVSDDAETWHDVQALGGSTELTDDLKLAQPASGRYVRVLMKQPATEYGYILSEIEVFGRGGFVAKPKPAAKSPTDRKLVLAGGSWKLQRANFVAEDGATVSKTGFKDEEWLAATVPGTVLTSYLNVGAIPDPNFGQNQLHISDSYFHSDFWYRTEFTAPAKTAQQTAWLNLDGIDWEADVFLNGEKLGRIEGGFIRGRFDVTQKLLSGKVNALAVRIEKNANPGSVHQKTYEVCSKNGGGLGADNPTFHSTVGWDWISTMRGRDIGIWGNVSLEIADEVTIENPFVSTKLPLPDVSSAELTVQADVINHQAHAWSGVVHGQIGEISFEQKVKLAGNERRTITLDPSNTPALKVQNPKLWWPTGYGDPYLYDVQISVRAGSKVLDSKSFKTGIRQMTYSEDGGDLRIWVNGRRFVARGGNWGFAESMLRYRAREYDAAVRYHREMNFTMIRNWVGQIPDEAFYEACDRHGVVVWQDFWLANPWDGPEPNDNNMFLKNAKDLVLRIRNHPSVGLYCGRNEGFPPPALESGLRQILSDLHPMLHYIPSSADKVVSGHGPYWANPAPFYFQVADKQLHSEIGAPNIPPIESVKLMMPEKALWPQALDWGIHDFCLVGAMGGAAFRSIVDNSYGGANSAEEWIKLAQFVNYDTYRAMFEAQSKYRMGVLLWMSHSCWPSFVWQTYDYYFEPTAAYYGCKKGSEPLHIQWNSLEDTIEVVNYSAGKAAGLQASVEILNMDGKRVDQKTATLDSAEDATVSCIRMSYPSGLTPVHFLRLSLMRGSETVSSNFYWRGLKQNDFKAIRELPAPKLEINTSGGKNGDEWQLRAEIQNTGQSPALMVRVKAVREKSGDRVLPAIYSDNYIALMPGESRTITVQMRDADTRGEAPKLVLA